MSKTRLAGLVKPEQYFRWRGTEVTRMESFSDAVFAFSVTLLVVSLEVPHSFAELMQVMRGFPAFGVCFALLALFWYAHVVYFRRYGLQSSYVAALNSALLFCILFYVYPLKFLFANLFVPHSALAAEAGFTPENARILFVIYGLGYAAVSLVFVLLYQHAWRQRSALQLNDVEMFETRHSLVDYLALMIIGLCSAGLALILPTRLIGLAGFFYFSIAIYFTIAGMYFGKRLRALATAARAG
jgi:uncharacterized membrane protein